MYYPNKVKSQNTLLLRILMCELALLFMSFYYYGKRAVYIALLAVIVSYILDVICVKLRHKTVDFLDVSPVVSGLTLALLMPASVDYYIVSVATFVMIVIGKQAFGGKENPVFNHVAIGYIFVSLCFKIQMFSYPVPQPMGNLDTASDFSGTLGNSFTYLASNFREPAIPNFDIMLGRIAGPMGTTHIVVLFVIALVLILSRVISMTTFFTIVGVVGGSAYFFDYMGTSKLTSLYYELISGSLLFGIIFIACDFVTAPRKRSARFFYGLTIGFMTIIFKRYSDVENAIVYAVILSNPLVGFFERYSDNVVQKCKFIYLNRGKIIKTISTRSKKFIIALAKLIIIFIKKLVVAFIIIGKSIVISTKFISKRIQVFIIYLGKNISRLCKYCSSKIHTIKDKQSIRKASEDKTDKNITDDKTEEDEDVK